MKTFKKVAIVSALALTMITTTALPSMAFSIGRTPYEKVAEEFASSIEIFGNQTGNAYENAAEEYADSIESLVDQTGNAYENATESYPENAVENPEAPAEYVDTATDLGDNHLKEIFSLTSGFLENIFRI